MVILCIKRDCPVSVIPRHATDMPERVTRPA